MSPFSPTAAFADMCYQYCPFLPTGTLLSVTKQKSYNLNIISSLQLSESLQEVCTSFSGSTIVVSSNNCQVLLQGAGPTHPLVETMWTTPLGLQNLSPLITAQYHALSHTPAVQLGVHDYFQQVAIKLVESIIGLETPNFSSMLQELKRGTFHQSTNWISIPEEYLGTNTPRTVSTSGSCTTMGGTATNVSGGLIGTGISSPTNDTAPHKSVTRVDNQAPDNEKFTSLTLCAGGTRAIARAHGPPTNDAGNEFYVAWWTRAGCNPNCGRCNTHRPFASGDERTRLLAYVCQHLVAQSA
jgi:hypothetical protein